MRRRRFSPFSTCLGLISIFFGMAGYAHAQSDSVRVGATLGEEILAPQTAEYELKVHLIRRVASPPRPSSAAQWTAEAQRLRARMLATAFHGWPPDWVNSPPKFEDLGVFATGTGYRLRKLRYEVVPGLQSTAILYEPENMQRKMPAILERQRARPDIWQGGGIQTEALHHLRPARHFSVERGMAGDGRARTRKTTCIGLALTWIWWEPTIWASFI